MTKIFLIRHGMCDHVGKYIAGRMKGISLNSVGCKQVETLAEKIKNIPISCIFTGPLERVVETAEIIGEKVNVKPIISKELDEVDYGSWTGAAFEKLSGKPLWNDFNNAHGSVRIPDGEMMSDVQVRMCSFIEEKRRLLNGNIIIVSHGDPIKTVIAHYIGIQLNSMEKILIDTASVTVLISGNRGVVLECVNCNC